jgi:hypothetical protein
MKDLKKANLEFLQTLQLFDQSFQKLEALYKGQLDFRNFE